MSSEDHPDRPVEGSLGPIARLRVDLGVMHLDRDFDYLVPDEWRETAVPGARVRVRFSGRLRDAYVIDRLHEADVDSPKPIERVIDQVPPLSPETLALIQDVADRYVGDFLGRGPRGGPDPTCASRILSAAKGPRFSRGTRAVTSAPPDGRPGGGPHLAPLPMARDSIAGTSGVEFCPGKRRGCGNRLPGTVEAIRRARGSSSLCRMRLTSLARDRN